MRELCPLGQLPGASPSVFLLSAAVGVWSSLSWGQWLWKSGVGLESISEEADNALSWLQLPVCG